MMLKTKATTGAPLLKADDASVGTVRVAFAQIGVVDHDGDYTMPGAFQPGQKVKMCQTGHAHGALPAGAGEIVGEEMIDGATWAVAELKFFLDTPHGEATYLTVKALAEAGHSQEWSYGYDILDAEHGQVDGKRVQILKALSAYEISPVLRGAGIGTHTLAVKSEAGTCEACGQSIPKAKDTDELDACEDCGKDTDGCGCEAEKAAAADALVKAGQTEQAFISWLAMKARRDGVPHS